MSEPKDPAIKLFGKTIPLPEITPVSGKDSLGAPISSATLSSIGNDKLEDPSTEEAGDGDETVVDKDETEAKLTEAEQKGGALPLNSEESARPDETSGTNENLAAPSVESKTTTLNSTNTDEEKCETGSQEKTLKKPDKILPCPRCNSMDTKFCYYNNYNVNQPRHFCKNCQRYWTAGGTMRNVPVGAGRRKNKNSASHYRHISVNEALQNAQADVANGFHHPAMKPNGTVLTFGSDSPLCESMASVLNLSENTIRNFTRNGFHKPEELKIPVPCGGKETWNDKSSGLSGKVVNPENEEDKTRPQAPLMQNCQAFPQIPCFPGAPWPYPWNSAQWNSPLPPPAFCPPGFPMPFYPTPAYWGCTMPGTWNIPWLPKQPSPNHMAQNTGPNSPTLGKHSRDENTVKPSNSEDEQTKDNQSEKCLWIPKTLRIDDPEEAAKSSIWATLGIKTDKGDSVSGGRLFKAFQSKSDEKTHMSMKSSALHANPAALSRSLNFHESS